MDPQRLARLRWWIMFTIVWLGGLFVFDILTEALGGTWSVVVAALTVAVNLFARRRLMTTIQRSWQTYLWMYLPGVVIIGVPLCIKIWQYTRAQDANVVADIVLPLLWRLVKYGVPATVLGWVHIMLGRWGARAANSPPGTG